MKTNDIKQIWKSFSPDDGANKRYSLNDIQVYRKKKSQQLSKTGSRAIYFDIVFKSLIAFALAYLVVFQVTESVYKPIISILISITVLLLGMNFIFLKKLKKIKGTDAIMDNLKNKLHYFETTYRNFIINSSFSNPLFVLTGFLFYFQFKYGEIRMETPWNDPVPYLFLLVAFIISFGAQWTNYKNEVRELTETIRDLDDEKLAAIKIEEYRKRRKRNLFIYSVLLLVGILILLFFLFG